MILLIVNCSQLRTFLPRPAMPICGRQDLYWLQERASKQACLVSCPTVLSAIGLWGQRPFLCDRRPLQCTGLRLNILCSPPFKPPESFAMTVCCVPTPCSVRWSPCTSTALNGSVLTLDMHADGEFLLVLQSASRSLDLLRIVELGLWGSTPSMKTRLLGPYRWMRRDFKLWQEDMYILRSCKSYACIFLQWYLDASGSRSMKVRCWQWSSSEVSAEKFERNIQKRLGALQSKFLELLFDGTSEEMPTEAYNYSL